MPTAVTTVAPGAPAWNETRTRHRDLDDETRLSAIVQTTRALVDWITVRGRREFSQNRRSKHRHRHQRRHDPGSEEPLFSIDEGENIDSDDDNPFAAYGCLGDTNANANASDDDDDDDDIIERKRCWGSGCIPWNVISAKMRCMRRPTLAVFSLGQPLGKHE